MILYDGWTLYDIKTPLHLFDTKRKSGRRVGVNAPPRTRAKIGQGYPSERQSDTATRRRTDTSPKSSPQATFWHRPKNEPTATKKHDTRPHTPPQCHRGQTSDKSDNEKTPPHHFTSQKPPRAAAETVRRQENAERATLRHHAHAPTHHERRRICTHEGATRVVIPQFYIYIIIFYSLCLFIYSLCLLYYSFFLLAVYIVLFAPLFRVCIMRACDIAAHMYIYSIFMYIYL